MSKSTCGHSEHVRAGLVCNSAAGQWSLSAASAYLDAAGLIDNCLTRQGSATLLTGRGQFQSTRLIYTKSIRIQPSNLGIISLELSIKIQPNTPSFYLVQDILLDRQSFPDSFTDSSPLLITVGTHCCSMAPLILHNVPEEELYIGEDGVQRPYAMIYPQYASLALESALTLFSTHAHMLTTFQPRGQPKQR